MNRKYTLDNGWLRMLAGVNINPEMVLQHANLPVQLIESERFSLTVDEYYRLWDSILSMKLDVDLPIQLIKAISSDMLSPPIFATLCSPNFSVAIQRLQQYKALIGPMLIDVTYDTHQNTIISLSGLPNDSPLPMSLSIIDLLFTVHLIRTGTQQNIKPLKVEFAHSIEHFASEKAFTQYFGVPLQQGVSNRIIFSQKSMLTPFQTLNHQLWQAFEPELKKDLRQLNDSTTFTEKVSSYLTDIIASGDFSIYKVANHLAVSARTLQRKLQSEQTTFHKTLAKVRINLATHYLTKTDYTNHEIAFLLGFDDPNSFFRAFKSWTGLTPHSFKNPSTFT